MGNENARLIKNAEEGDVNAMIVMGDVSYKKKVTSCTARKQINSEFVYWYTKAADMGSIEAITTLAKYYLEEGRNKGKAIELYELAAKNNNISAIYCLIEYYESNNKNDYGPVLKLYEQLIDLKVDMDENSEIIAEIYQKMGSYENAIKWLIKIKNPSYQTLYRLARLYSINGQNRLALDLFEKIMYIARTTTVYNNIMALTHNGAADIYAHMHQYNMAFEHYLLACKYNNVIAMKEGCYDKIKEMKKK